MKIFWCLIWLQSQLPVRYFQSPGGLRWWLCNESHFPRGITDSLIPDCNPYSQLIGCFHKVAGLCNHIVPALMSLSLNFKSLLTSLYCSCKIGVKIRMHKTLWDMLSFDAVKSGTKSSLGYLPDSYLRVPAAGTTVHRWNQAGEQKNGSVGQPIWMGLESHGSVPVTHSTGMYQNYQSYVYCPRGTQK